MYQLSDSLIFLKNRTLAIYSDFAFGVPGWWYSDILCAKRQCPTGRIFPGDLSGSHQIYHHPGCVTTNIVFTVFVILLLKQNGKRPSRVMRSAIVIRITFIQSSDTKSAPSIYHPLTNFIRKWKKRGEKNDLILSKLFDKSLISCDISALSSI